MGSIRREPALDRWRRPCAWWWRFLRRWMVTVIFASFMWSMFGMRSSGPIVSQPNFWVWSWSKLSFGDLFVSVDVVWFTDWLIDWVELRDICLFFQMGPTRPFVCWVWLSFARQSLVVQRRLHDKVPLSGTATSPTMTTSMCQTQNSGNNNKPYFVSIHFRWRISGIPDLCCSLVRLLWRCTCCPCCSRWLFVSARRRHVRSTRIESGSTCVIYSVLFLHKGNKSIRQDVNVWNKLLDHRQTCMNYVSSM